jgi:ATP-dependent 26S proteasome regulatory subunit
MIEPLTEVGELLPSHGRVAERLVAAWSEIPGRLQYPAVQLYGVDGEGKRAIAAAVCATLGFDLHAMHAETIPTAPGELDRLIRLWTRGAALGASALLVDCDEVDASDTARWSAIATMIERVGSPLIVITRDRQRTRRRRTLALEVRRPTQGEQRTMWQEVLSSMAARGYPPVNGQVDTLVAQFDLSAPTIRAAGAEALGEMDGPGDPMALAWDACRDQARTGLDDLAQRIEPSASWEELVLPEAQHSILREIAVHVRERTTVYQTWGFAGKGMRGLGISALFAGPSGTGKTMAAEVLAQELRLDLYRIDLSSVVSKYIGETEKNLRRVFDAAEESGAILLFDEADALFGKRSEVKDSHDRYANIEVSYLLQRMEAYRGLAILTTNLKKALDPAFLRRIRFVVQFPFPDAPQRAEIWRRVFPPATPTDGLDVALLSRLNVAGGNIRNIALHAAFLAADAGTPVQMTHLLRAARTEYAKLEKPLTGAEMEGWE